MPSTNYKEMEETARKVDAPFREAIAGFKPVFGDSKHIQLVEDIGEINRMEKELKQKIAAAKGGAALAEQINQKKQRVISMMDVVKPPEGFKIIILAGTHQQYVDYLEYHGLKPEDAVYGENPDKISMVVASRVVTTGTFGIREDASRLYDLAKTRVRQL